MSFYNRCFNYFAGGKGKDLLFLLTVPLVLLMFQEKIASFFSPKLPEGKQGDPYGVFSEELLAKYNGVIEDKLYLAVLGSVFDVSKGAKYYAKGASYHYFVGKDGSRALITGDFTDESENKDNVIDLSCSDIYNLLNWKATFQEKYIPVGVLKGRYYDKNGKETVYHKELFHRINQCEEDKKASKEHQLRYPPCNIAWNPDEGSKVWCTKTSGGISRDWVGVPRQLYTPGQDQPHCVCVNLNKETSMTMKQFKEYYDCPETSSSCTVDIS